MATVVNGIDANHRRILKGFVAGRTLEAIADTTGFNVPTVKAVIERVAGNDKARAAELVRQYELELQRDGKAPSTPTPPPKPAAPAPTATPYVRPSVRDLLDEAEATGDKRLVAQAAKVRALLKDIRERLDGIQEEQAARAEVARLEAELAAAKARLRGGKPAPMTPAPPGEPTTGPSPAELRVWALKHNIPCPAQGRIPKHVREAWDAERAA